MIWEAPHTHEKHDFVYPHVSQKLCNSLPELYPLIVSVKCIYREVIGPQNTTQSEHNPVKEQTNQNTTQLSLWENTGAQWTLPIHINFPFFIISVITNHFTLGNQTI